MPFDASGIYTRPIDSVTGVEFDYTADLSAGKPRSIVDAADMDAHFDDLKTALSKTLLRDTTVPMTADQNFNFNDALNIQNFTFDGNLTFLRAGATDHFNIRSKNWATTGVEIRVYDDSNYWGMIARGTEWCGFQIGQGRTSDGPATVQFRSASAHGDWSAYIQRAAGSNGVFEFRNQGSGAIQLKQLDAGDIELYTNNALRFSIDSSGNLLHDGPNVDFKRTSTGTVGAIVALQLDSSSPADADLIGRVQFQGRNSGQVMETYAYINVIADDVSAATEDAAFEFITMIGGVRTARCRLGAGLYRDGISGGDKGDFTVNVTAVYDDNVLLTCMPIEEVLTGSYDEAVWRDMGADASLAAYEEMKARGYDPNSADHFVAEMEARQGIPGMWTRDEARAAHKKTPTDPVTGKGKGKPDDPRVSMGERHERFVFAHDLSILALRDAVYRIRSLEQRIETLESMLV